VQKYCDFLPICCSDRKSFEPVKGSDAKQRLVRIRSHTNFRPTGGFERLNRVMQIWRWRAAEN
jgi:hypothetical protein